jgi:hypothetical protein
VGRYNWSEEQEMAEAPLDIIRVISVNMKKLEAVTILNCTGPEQEESKKER